MVKNQNDTVAQAMHASIGKREHSKLEIDAARSGGTAASQVLGVAAV